LVLILFFWLILTPDNGQVLMSGPSVATTRLQRQRQAHGVLTSTKWGDFTPRQMGETEDIVPRYINLTGFREGDGYGWEDFADFRNRCQERSRNAYSPTNSDDWNRPGPSQFPWKNVTGRVNGEWVRRPGSVVRQAAGYNLTHIAPDSSWQGAYSDWARNVTGAHGKIAMHLEEYDTAAEYVEETSEKDLRSASVVRETAAFVSLQDEASGSMTWSMRLHGVHWPRQGAILLTTTSEKFAGIFGLPHLSPGPDFFQSSQKLLNVTTNQVLRKKEHARYPDPSNPWTSTVEGPDDPWALTPYCEYIMYLQLYPLDPHDTVSNNYYNHARGGFGGLLDEMEKELRHPTGAPIKAVPDLHMSLVAWSPDCGYFLESKGPPLYPSTEGEHLVGVKEEVFLSQVKIWLLALAAVFVGQIWLLKTQMKEICTPSTVGRVSFYTTGLMFLADGIVCTAAATLSLASPVTFLSCLMVTFTSFMSMIIGGAFLSDVYKIQEPERRNRERGRGPGGAAPSARSTFSAAAATTQGTSLPPPVTAGPLRPVSPPIIIPSDQDIDAEIAEAADATATAPTTAVTDTTTTAPRPPQMMTFASITGRFVFVGVLIIFVSVAATSWPAPIRALYTNTLAFIYLSLWIPQIWRNIQRNSRRAFAWRFMIGQSILRLAPFAYFYLYHNNVIFAEPDWRSFSVLVAWLWIQLWILAFQDVLGPRFGIPASWAPEAWDYHPVLREDNVEAGGLPIGLVGSFNESAPGSPTVERARSSSGGLDVEDCVTGRERDKDYDKKGMRIQSIDCAICREVLDVPVVKAGAVDPTGGGVAGVLARRAYMVTPCRHIFHTKCLEGWLRFRLQCPICRDELPPL